jgi:hypothetical protein
MQRKQLIANILNREMHIAIRTPDDMYNRLCNEIDGYSTDTLTELWEDYREVYNERNRELGEDNCL